MAVKYQATVAAEGHDDQIVQRNVGDNESELEIEQHLAVRGAAALGVDLADVTISDVEVVNDDGSDVTDGDDENEDDNTEDEN